MFNLILVDLIGNLKDIFWVNFHKGRPNFLEDYVICGLRPLTSGTTGIYIGTIKLFYNSWGF